MKYISIVIFFLTFLFAQNEIEGRWHLVGYENNIMYQFEDNYRYSIYSMDGNFGGLEDAGNSPNPYTVEEDIITIDLFFGNIVNYQMNYRCDGQVVDFIYIPDEIIHSTLFREGYNFIDNECEEILIVTDIDGNIYQTIQIGDQLWMAENLKVTHYNNGDPVTYITSEEPWGSMDEGQYGIYDDELTNANIYGNLYNWAVIGDIRGICPEDWHVPSDDEYTVLTDFLGGESVAGGKRKEAVLEHLNYYSDQISLEATNESGFTGLPAGHRNTNTGNYIYMSFSGYFWSSTETSSDLAWRLYLLDYSSGVGQDTFGKPNGFSIRCVNDAYISGDINGDSSVNIQDIVLAVNLVLSGEYNNLADLNSDSTVDILDIVQLVNIILT